MSRALSLDLRERVVSAVSTGLSRRQAADRFGVSIASAMRWCTRERQTRSAAAKPRGGDRLSHRIKAQADRIRVLIAERDDLTLVEIRARLADDGHHFAIGTLWRFFARHQITWKKVCARGRAGSPGHPDATAGVVRRSARSRPRTAGVHRRNLGIDQYGAPLRTLPQGPPPAVHRAARALEDHDLHRRLAAGRDRGAHGSRWSDQWTQLPDLCRARAGAGSASRRHRRHGQSRLAQGDRACKRQSKPLEPVCGFSRPTARTSTQLKWYSPSSRAISAAPPNERATPCETGLAA